MTMFKYEGPNVIGLHDLLAYMDSLSRAQAAGHKVDNELKEAIKLARIETGITNFAKDFEKTVKERTESEAGRLARRYLMALKKEGLITFEEESIAQDRLFELRLPEDIRQ